MRLGEAETEPQLLRQPGRLWRIWRRHLCLLRLELQVSDPVLEATLRALGCGPLLVHGTLPLEVSAAQLLDRPKLLEDGQDLFRRGTNALGERLREVDEVALRENVALVKLRGKCNLLERLVARGISCQVRFVVSWQAPTSRLKSLDRVLDLRNGRAALRVPACHRCGLHASRDRAKLHESRASVVRRALLGMCDTVGTVTGRAPNAAPGALT